VKTNDKDETRKDGTGLDKATQDNKRQHNTTPNNTKQHQTRQPHTPYAQGRQFSDLLLHLPFVFGAQKQMVRTNLNVQTKWL